MNRSLRRAHGACVLGLAILLPLGVGAALLAREPVPILAAEDLSWVQPQAAAPSNLPAVPMPTPAGMDLRLARLRDAGAADAWLEIVALPASHAEKPDVLIYYSKLAPLVSTQALPGGVSLLGNLGSAPRLCLPLPKQARAGGFILFYSLGHAQVLGSSPLSSREL